MKNFFKKLMYIHLKILVKIIIKIKNPYIILVVWVSNKSIIREKIKDHLISKWLNTREKYKPYNTYFGVLLDFMNLNTIYNAKLARFIVYIKSWIKFFKNLISFPEYIVLQWWIDKEWESDAFLKNLKPKMIVFTDIDNVFSDDYRKNDIIENEFYQMASYLNNISWSNKENISETISFENIDEIIKEKNKWIWIIVNESEKINNIKSKLKNWVKIK